MEAEREVPSWPDLRMGKKVNKKSEEMGYVQEGNPCEVVNSYCISLD